MAGQDPDRRPMSRLFRYAIITTFMFILAIAVAILIIWLVVKAAPLEYTVEDANVRGFNLTSDGKLNATFHLRLMTDNRNKKVSVIYDSLRLAVYYKDQFLAAAEMGPFHQPNRNATRIMVDPVARDVVLAGDVANGMRMDRSSTGKVELTVEVTARIRFKVAAVRSKHYNLWAYCSSVVVPFSPENDFRRSYCEGKTVVGESSCAVEETSALVLPTQTSLPTYLSQTSRAQSSENSPHPSSLPTYVAPTPEMQFF